MKNRLARIFDPEDSRTVMLAIDHGYFQGPTTGLERIDITIVPLIAHADALMVTRGSRDSIPAEIETGRVAFKRRPEHPQGTFERTGGCRYRRCHSPERIRLGRSGLYWRGS